MNDSVSPNHKQNILIRVIITSAFCVVILLFGAVLLQIVSFGITHLNLDMFSLDGGFSSVVPSMINTFFLVVGTLIVAVPISVFAAMFLWYYEHHMPSVIHVLQALIDSLGAVPSIVYALFGLILFVGQMQLGFSLIAGILTMTIIILPVLIRASEQALQAIPTEVYLSGLSLGLSKMYVMLYALLPQAMNGICSGIVLAVGRIVGESAALLFTMGTASGIVDSFLSSGRTLSVQVYSLAGEGLYLSSAYATSFVLLLFVAGLHLISYAFLRKGRKYGRA